MSEPDYSRLHGLIIGIDQYKDTERHHTLYGCVKDASSMLAYFTKDLEVPSSHFKTLFNEEATRDGIIDAFSSHLIKNPDIKPLDPIVIYYAGHGSQCHSTVVWESNLSDETIETIVSYDGDTKDSNGGWIFGIPDRTLGALVYCLSRAKGNNITIILDSCHSGSGSRGRRTGAEAEEEILTRSSKVIDAPPIPHNLDDHIIQALLPENPTDLQKMKSSRGVSKRFLAPSLETHILLAACRSEEKAQDTKKGGVFTIALLRALRACDPSTTGYSTLLRAVLERTSRHKPLEDIPKYFVQTPQCEGRNQDRLLFSTQFSASKGKIALLRTTSPGVFRIKAGSAVGIVPGTEFGVFSDSMRATATPKFQLVAADVGPTGALLRPLEVDPNRPLELPADAYVAIIKYNDHPNAIRVLVNDRSTFPAPWPEVFQSLESLPVIWTKPGEASDLVLAPTEDGAEVQRNTYSLERPGPAHVRLKSDVGVKKLSEILRRIVHFHFQLQHHNPQAPLQAKLGMKLQELRTIGRDKWRIPEYEPHGVDYFEECLANGTVASVQANTEKLFGLTLTNDSDEAFFPFVLYYNFEDYSVTCLYDPPSRSIQAPLPAKGSLAIGYGTGGSDAFNVELTNPESKREYGMFVLLVFSEWADISYLQHESPFEESTDRAQVNWQSRSGAKKSGVWDKIAVRVSIYP